jgi:hypothetical protein
MLTVNLEQLGMAPDEVLLFGVDWSKTAWSMNGDIVADSEWFVPTGVTQSNSSFDAAGSLVTLQYTSPDTVVLGSTFDIKCHVTTAAGQEVDQSYTLVCVQY